MQRRLERSTTNRVWTGVCGGVAEYLAIDATLVRAFFVVATILTAFLFVLVYIALVIIMPLPGQRAPIDDLWPGSHPSPASYAAPPDATATDGTPAEVAPRPPRPLDPAEDERRRNAIGFVLIALGFIFLLSNLGMFRFLQWSVTWPIVLIAVGLLFLFQRGRA